MQIRVKSKNIDLTDALKDYAIKKLSRIQKYFDQILTAEVMLSTLRNFHIVEVTVHVNGRVLRTEEKSDDMYSSIDMVVDKIERQVRKVKEKRKNHHHTKEESPVFSKNGSTENEVRVLLRKQRVSSFTPEEAMQEMDRLGYNFYLFQNRESDSLNLVYRREEGNFALIEPVVS